MIWMTEKMQEIEQFLFYLRDIYSQNSKISINMRNIYSNLMFYGIDLSKKCKIKNFHEEWEEYFSNFDNIEVSGGNEGYFCHFQNIRANIQSKFFTILIIHNILLLNRVILSEENVKLNTLRSFSIS